MWYNDVIAVHTAVTDAVSHVQRMASDRYFVWEENDMPILYGDGKPVAWSHEIVTDLFTKTEFDTWVDDFIISLVEHGYGFSYDFVDFEPDTGFYHHQWRWYVYG